MALETYEYGGARALVALHDKHLRDFLEVWREVDERAIELPESSDPNFGSRAALLAHVLGCAARYLIWICERMELDPPVLEERPDPVGLPERAAEYLEVVLAAWRGPLATLTEAAAYQPAYESRWGTPYCIDAMLEHAVMHPIRHSYQLRGLLQLAHNPPSSE